MALAKRLREIRLRLGLTQREAASTMGCSTSTWQNYEAGETFPQERTLTKLCDLGFSGSWILTGDGPMLSQGVSHEDWLYSATGSSEVRKNLDESIRASRSARGPRSGPRGAHRLPPLDPQLPPYVVLPRLGNVEAGPDEETVAEHEQLVDHLAFKREWLESGLEVDPASLLLVRVVGDSMDPTISDGDLVLADTSNPRIVDNAIYVLAVGGDLLVKRIQKRLDGTVIVLSENPVYPPEEIRPDQKSVFNIVGRVIWAGGSI